MHRQAPWAIDEYGDHEISIFDADGELVCELIQWYNPQTGRGENPTIEADAQLIAAAPDMYKVLVQLVDAFDSDEYGATDVLDMLGSGNSQARAIVKKMRKHNV